MSADLEICCQRGALGFESRKATSISDLILSKAIVSSRGQRLAAPASPRWSLGPSESGPLHAAAAAPPSTTASLGAPVLSGKLGISSIGVGY